MACSSELSERTLKAAVQRLRKDLIDGVRLDEFESCLERLSFMSDKEWSDLKTCAEKDQMSKLIDHLNRNVVSQFDTFVVALEESCHSDLSTFLKQTACLLHHEKELMAIETKEVAVLLSHCTASLYVRDTKTFSQLASDEEKFKFLFNELLPKNAKYFDIFTLHLRKTHGSLAKRMRQLAETDTLIRDSKDLSHSESVRSFEAKHRSSGAKRLVKEYDLSMCTAEEAKQAYETLLKLQTTLKSIGLNYIQQVEKGDTKLSVICDFYSEPSLEQKLSDAETEKEPFTEEETVHILQDAIQTLRKLHQSDIIHGNITPSCIIRDDKSEMQLVDIRICGLHKLQDTQPGLSAPEVKRGGQPTWASDIWCLGAVAFRMLTGEDPPGRTNRRHLFPRGIEVSRKVKKLVKKMLRNDPNRRPNTDRVLKCLSEPTNIVRRFTLRISKLGRSLRNGPANVFSLPRDAASVAAFQETLQRTKAPEGGPAVDEPRECLAVVVVEKDGSVETLAYDDVNKEWIRWNENVMDGKSGKRLIVHSTSCFVPLGDNRGLVVDTANKKTYWSEDLLAGSWSKQGAVPDCCFGASGVKAADTVYITGDSKDRNGKEPVDCVMRFSVTTKEWLPSATGQQATHDPAVAFCSKRVFVIGGNGKDGLPVDKIQYISAEDSMSKVVWSIVHPLKPLLKSALPNHKLSLLEATASTVVSLPQGVYRLSCLESRTTASKPMLRMNKLATSLGEYETTVIFRGSITTACGNAVRMLQDEKNVTDLPTLPLWSDAVRSFVTVLRGDIALR